jgi:tRNA threonylcarbamoyladenosine biosynthesis protein TsaB
MIVSIDTSTDTASVSLSRDGVVLQVMENDSQKDHAAWIQVAIAALLQQQGVDTKDITAVAVAEGPGSYTGLRVAMATAKGLCFALQIPLITVSTLKIMAYAARAQWLPSLGEVKQPVRLCPMIDARRMEVFTAVYNEALEVVAPAAAVILDEHSFKEALNNGSLVCFGNGSNKWKNIIRHPNLIFIDERPDMAKALAKLATDLYLSADFADLAYAEPAYLKEFYSYMKK